MVYSAFTKRISDIMRQDAGINGDAQRIEQMVWMIFLKIYDDAEDKWEWEDSSYQSLLAPLGLRWRQWAAGDAPNKLTADKLLTFVNDTLIPKLQDLELTMDVSPRQGIIKRVFTDVHNFMKDGVVFREVLAVIDELDFADPEETHAFGEIYESLLRELQNAGRAGEFYTPRALTDFIANHVNLKLSDKIADLACGTGGFLNSACKVLKPYAGAGTEADRELLNHALYGIEKKPFPFLLAVTNLLLNGIDAPQIVYGNSLENKPDQYGLPNDFDVILMNPPYGGTEKATTQEQVTKNKGLASSETADLFMIRIMQCLSKHGGRAAVVLPDGFLFGSGNKTAIKQRLLTTANLHTVVRLPHDVFAPYTNIRTNILFFDRPASKDIPPELVDQANKTQKTWVYRVDMPKGYKHFSKTKPIKLEHLNDLAEWWDNRRELKDENGYDKARCYTYEELEANDFNLDLCGIPEEKDEIMQIHYLAMHFQQQDAALTAKINEQIARLMAEIDSDAETGESVKSVEE